MTTDFAGITYSNQLYANRLDSLDEMYRFLEINKLPEWTQEEWKIE